MTDDLQRITDIICEVGKISGVGPDEDIYDAGFSSINALELLMELESALEVSLPDDDFINARSPRALHAVIERLRQEQPA
jgi:acyl carrier protein